jgi:hypothetical protein
MNEMIGEILKLIVEKLDLGNYLPCRGRLSDFLLIGVGLLGAHSCCARAVFVDR